jgi:hypothetical protein
MNRVYDIVNYRVLYAKWSDHKVKIWEEPRCGQKRQTVKLPEPEDGVMEYVYECLVRSGWKVVGRGGSEEHYVFFCDNWGADFLYVKDIKPYLPDCG